VGLLKFTVDAVFELITISIWSRLNADAYTFPLVTLRWALFTSKNVSFPFISTIWGGFFKRPKAVGFCLIRDKSYGLGTLFLTKWEALWRKVYLVIRLLIEWYLYRGHLIICEVTYFNVCECPFPCRISAEP